MNEVRGKVKWFNQDKGYGFVAGDDGIEYFVHYNGLVKGLKGLNKDDMICFTKGSGKKGPVAENTRKV